MQGVCCVCQETHPVSYSSLPRLELQDIGWDDEDIDNPAIGFGEEINYVLDSHDSYGKHCTGSYQIPQALILK